MKHSLTVALVLVLGLVFVSSVVAQWAANDPYPRKLATSTMGTFKDLSVVSCDAAKNTCVIKTKKEGDQTGNMTYASYNGGFNAAKQLKPGDKISGQWKKIEGAYYITFLIKD